MADIESSRRARPSRQLSLIDCTSIIVGIIIGSGLYESAPLIAASVPGPWWLLGVWVAGGCFALVGAMCYAELATTYPQEGGEYVYLSKAFGRWAGFFFAWSQMWVIRPGSIGTMAYVLGRYATELIPLGPWSLVIYATGSVALLTLINVVGVRSGSVTQNVLTAAKVLGLLGVVLIGLFFSQPTGESAAPTVRADGDRIGLALIFVMFTYGGWNDMAFVAAEVRRPEKNIFRALLLGTGSVMAIYLLVNGAFLAALGFDGLADSAHVATDVAQLAMGGWGALAVSLLICISALGAINGMIFTGARVIYALGTQHRLFAPLGRWNARLDTPLLALLFQSGVALLVIVGVGLLGQAGGDAFERLVIFTAPLMWLFLTAAGLSLAVLRWRDARPRGFAVPLYPLPPLIFCCGSLAMAMAALQYAVTHPSAEAWWTLVWTTAGVACCAIDARLTRPQAP